MLAGDFEREIGALEIARHLLEHLYPDEIRAAHP
jgi:hypothetical protein